MEKQEVISKNVENVVCTMGTQSKKSNTVSMAVPDDFILEALNFYREKRKNSELEKGLIRLELVAVYEDGEQSPITGPPRDGDLLKEDQMQGRWHDTKYMTTGITGVPTTGTSGIAESNPVEQMIDDLDEVTGE